MSTATGDSDNSAAAAAAETPATASDIADNVEAELEAVLDFLCEGGAGACCQFFLRAAVEDMRVFVSFIVTPLCRCQRRGPERRRLGDFDLRSTRLDPKQTSLTQTQFISINVRRPANWACGAGRRRFPSGGRHVWRRRRWAKDEVHINFCFVNCRFKVCARLRFDEFMSGDAVDDDLQAMMDTLRWRRGAP